MRADFTGRGTKVVPRLTDNQTNDVDMIRRGEINFGAPRGREADVFVPVSEDKGPAPAKGVPKTPAASN